MADIRSLIRSAAARLTNADRSIAQILLDDPEVAAMLTASQIAARAKVHEAAATRFAQRLGFKGFPELRTALRHDVLAARDAVSRLESSVARMRDQGILSALVDDDVAALRSAKTVLDPAALEAAVDRLWAAERVFLFARGHASALGLLAARRLRRFGKAVIPLDGDARDVAETIHAVGARDVLIAVAFRRVPRLLVPAMEVTVEHGGACVLLCDPLIDAAGLPAAVTLAAPRGRPDHEFQTLTVPMAVLNAMVLTMGAREAAEPALKELARLIDRFESA